MEVAQGQITLLKIQRNTTPKNGMSTVCYTIDDLVLPSWWCRPSWWLFLPICLCQWHFTLFGG